MASRMFCASALARRAVVVAPRPRLFKRYYAEAAPAATGAATKITLTIATPVLTVVKPTEVDSVILPGLSGEFEVGANLVPVISELQAGVVTINNGADKKRYFISGGFAFVHEDSTCSVNPVECVAVDDLDGEAARTALSEAQSRLSSSTTEADKAIAQIMVDTAEAVLRAVGK